MNKDDKIYVAGHRGLVGSAIVRRLRKEGFTNIITRTSKDLDLTNQFDTENFFELERPDYVFLAAAKVGGIMANSTYPAEFIYENLMIAVNVVEAWFKLYISASCSTADERGLSFNFFFGSNKRGICTGKNFSNKALQIL